MAPQYCWTESELLHLMCQSLQKISIVWGDSSAPNVRQSYPLCRGCCMVCFHQSKKTQGPPQIEPISQPPELSAGLLVSPSASPGAVASPLQTWPWGPNPRGLLPVPASSFRTFAGTLLDSSLPPPPTSLGKLLLQALVSIHILPASFPDTL